MRNSTIHIATFVLLSSLTAGLAQSKYSGIYSGAGNDPRDHGAILAAITAGGRILALSDATDGINDVTDPARSTVNKNGVVKAFVQTGNRSVTGKIDGKFVWKGTVKEGNRTTRYTMKRVFK